MKKLLFTSIISLLAISSFAQNAKRAELLADETNAIETKSAYIITTDNDEVFNKISTTYAGKMKKITIAFHKKDRIGEYTEYKIYFPKEMSEKVEAQVTQMFNEKRRKG